MNLIRVCSGCRKPIRSDVFKRYKGRKFHSMLCVTLYRAAHDKKDNK